MISTMAYALAVACVLALAALVTDRLCSQLRWPRRGAWLAALVTSLALPAYAIWLAPNEDGTAVLSLPFSIDIDPGIVPAELRAVAGAMDGAWLRWPDWAALDSLLVGIWVGGSVVTMLLLAAASLRLGALVRRSAPAAFGAGDSVVSERLGPAVVGFLHPRIVVPRWIADGDPALRALVLRHERAHVAARDHLILLGGLLTVALAPWNVALWWQLRRLRAAIEIDCDARVVASGTDAAAYSEALLTVRQHSAAAPIGAVTLTEPMSEIERRIRTMIVGATTLSRPKLACNAALAALLAGLAFSFNAPHAQQTAAEPAARFAIRESVYLVLREAQACAQAEDWDCAHARLEETAHIDDLNDYELAQYWTFRAFVAYGQGDVAAATTMYENVLRFPELPSGMRRQTLYTVAQLQHADGQHERALETFDEWLALTSDPASNAYLMRATIEYQLGRIDAALDTVELAIAGAEEPNRGAYELLLALQQQKNDRAGMAETLEFMNARWPDDERVLRLQGIDAGED